MKVVRVTFSLASLRTLGVRHGGRDQDFGDLECHQVQIGTRYGTMVKLSTQAFFGLKSNTEHFMCNNTQNIDSPILSSPY